jgi:N-methylhydantoinase B
MSPRSNADPITMEVVKNALSSIADEMALVIMRTAYSSIVRDSMDYSTGLCDREGRVVAHGLTMALHLGSFPDAMRVLTREYAGRVEPGDVFVFNDPYVAGGMHLPDVYIVQPIFHADELEGYAATLVHQIDMGGIAPGSTAVYADEIFQEGLRIPIVKMYERGRPNETFFKLMAANTRMPEKLAGDMRAQIAACRTADKAYRALVEKYGRDSFRGLVEDLHDHAERMMRAEIAALPDGRWSFTDWIDGLGEAPEPLPLAVTVTIAGSDITVDWSGSAPQVPGAINCPVPFVKSAAHLILKCVAREDVPNFEGFTRPIAQVAPEGTIVNPRLPAACAARAIVGWRAIDALLGVFAQIAPDRVPAAGEGGVSFPIISGYHDGQRYVCSETLAGSWGAMGDRDGVFGVPNPGGNLTNQPIEMIEALYPIEVTEYGLVPDSGGPGRFRGAPAFVRSYRLLGDEATLIMRSDRRRFLPYPLDGGGAGTPSWNIVNPGPEQRILPVMPMDPLRLTRGDVFQHVSAGGAGRGDPLLRDPALVLEDVIEGRLTPGYARAVYGVVIDAATLTVDAAATAHERAALAAARRWGPARRPAYLELFLRRYGIEEFELIGERELRLA